MKPSQHRHAPLRDPAAAARTLFKESFGHAPTHLVRVPARLELLGSHAEWNDGLALAVAVDRYLCLASAPRLDGRVKLVSSAYPQREAFWLSDFGENPHAPWTALVKAMLGRLRARGVHFGGFNAVVHSEIPPGAGFGSSGALLAAAALTIRQLYPHKLTESGATVRRLGREKMPPPTKLERLRLARLCQQAASGVAAEAGGRLDAVASLCGEEFSATLMDAQHGTVESLPLIGEVMLIVCDTGRLNPIVEAQSAALRFHCAGAAKALGVKSLRAAELAHLKAARQRLTARQHACAYHVIGENQRIVAAERALREGDLPQFGQYLLQSHESARDFFQNTAPDLDWLVERARQAPACLGARLSGHGFGGFTVNLVLWNDADEFIRMMEADYHAATGRQLRTFRCRVVSGGQALPR
ncbi:MAG: hypothetical protein EBS05_13525 [Proteobacteria bacterium]|nr:hypothetical protein [Pseudomonadota bacterium]